MFRVLACTSWVWPGGVVSSIKSIPSKQLLNHQHPVVPTFYPRFQENPAECHKSGVVDCLPVAYNACAPARPADRRTRFFPP